MQFYSWQAFYSFNATLCAVSLPCICQDLVSRCWERLHLFRHSKRLSWLFSWLQSEYSTAGCTSIQSVSSLVFRIDAKWLPIALVRSVLTRWLVCFHFILFNPTTVSWSTRRQCRDVLQVKASLPTPIQLLCIAFILLTGCLLACLTRAPVRPLENTLYIIICNKIHWIASSVSFCAQHFLTIKYSVHAGNASLNLWFYCTVHHCWFYGSIQILKHWLFVCMLSAT